MIKAGLDIITEIERFIPKSFEGFQIIELQ